MPRYERDAACAPLPASPCAYSGCAARHIRLGAVLTAPIVHRRKRSGSIPAAYQVRAPAISSNNTETFEGDEMSKLRTMHDSELEKHVEQLKRDVSDFSSRADRVARELKH